MTRAVFIRGTDVESRLNGRLFGLSVIGHSGFGEEGTDIVCAAISSAMRLTHTIISEVVGMEIATSVKDGMVSMAVPHNLIEDHASMCHTVFSGVETYFRQLALEYPENVAVNIVEEE